jgi:phosphatidylserine/phosphatidylglycerophosphate/cardiolipin synthase-like enzyme
VRFHLVVNGLDAPEREARVVALATRHAVRKLMRSTPDGSITVTEWQRNAKRNKAGIHQKVAIFGEHGPVLVGSSNLDYLSLERNSELVVESRDHRVRQQLTGLMNRALREGESHVLTREARRHDSFATRAKGWLVNNLLGRRLLGRRH